MIIRNSFTYSGRQFERDSARENCPNVKLHSLWVGSTAILGEGAPREKI
jgi:hypothetical protein